MTQAPTIRITKETRIDAEGLVDRIKDFIEEAATAGMKEKKFVKGLTSIFQEFKKKERVRAMEILEEDLKDQPETLLLIKNVYESMAPKKKKNKEDKKEEGTGKIKLIKETEFKPPIKRPLTNRIKDEIRYRPGIIKADMKTGLRMLVWNLKHRPFKA